MEWKKEITANRKKKQIEIVCGDILNVANEYDLLVCSSFKGDYAAFPGTLIGNLSKEGISVESEAEHAEIDCRKSKNYWVSQPLNNKFGRLGCIELLDLNNRTDEQVKTLCKLFSTFYDMLVNMEQLGIAPSKVILPVLGSGNQNIELCYIIPPLINQCMRALAEIECLEKITFCDYDIEKVKKLVSMLESTDNINKNSDVFISYCSAQREYADCLRKMLTERGVKCWMAPYSIPTGSSYQTEIPSALSNTPNVLLVLSKEAETSRWVQKEIGCAIGARHKLIPIRSYMYEISPQFNFLLDGEQIYDVDNKLDMEENCAKAADYLLKIIKSDDIEKLCENNKKLNNKKACGVKTYKNVSKNKSAKRNIFDLMKDKILIGIGITIVIELWAIIRELKSDK